MAHAQVASVFIVILPGHIATRVWQRHTIAVDCPTKRGGFPMSRIAIAALAAACMSVSLHAQDYPARPVKIVVPFAVGGPADIYARFLGAKLGESLGQAFVIENRPGAGAVVGTEVAAKSAPDGYTLLLMSNAHTVNETLIANKPYSLTRDFVAVAPVNYSDLMLVLNPSVQANSVQELIALAKAQPGKLNYASSGPGTPYHMAGELFKAMAGVDIVHVPYKESSAARTGVIGGQVEMMFDAVTTMNEQAKAGKVRALATSGKARSPVTPNLPTVSEAGVPGYEAVIWLGVMAPKGTPPAIVARLNAEIAKIVNRAETREDWAKQGASAMTMTPDEFAKYVTDDVAKWQKVIQVSGAKPDR
jgi:tripartite-type tricarboxylate transporter receptor subunit TctC